jgi:hypothetical protein
VDFRTHAFLTPLIVVPRRPVLFAFLGQTMADGEVHIEMRRGVAPYQRSSKSSCQTCGAHENVPGSAQAAAVPAPFAKGTSTNPLDFRPRQESFQWFLRQCDEDPFSPDVKGSSLLTFGPE